MSYQRINVTKTILPDLKIYVNYLERIWQTDQLTNQGPLLHEFEQAICGLLGVSHFHFVANGTLALQISLRAIGIEPKDEVITTPFSYVATTSAILWERASPVFVDIDSENFNIDPRLIEKAITPRTKAILAVHVFGNPCAIDEINDIAKKHSLKVIYDGAHAFGVKINGKGILSAGDISTCSFHATKLIHTIEGGGIVTNSSALSERIELMKRFGHNGDDHFMLGINAKASEFQAAMGLSLLPEFARIIRQRKHVYERYLANINNDAYKMYVPANDVSSNYAYFPLLARSDKLTKKLIKALSSKNIFVRRYFYPALNKLSYVNGAECPIAEDIAERIICLPLYPGLNDSDIDKICGIANEVAKN